MTFPNTILAAVVVAILSVSVSACSTMPQACSTDACRQDQAINRRVVDAFGSHPGFAMDQLTIQTENGVVYLYGRVDSAFQIQQASRIAMVDGATKVVNNLSMTRQ